MKKIGKILPLFLLLSLVFVWTIATKENSAFSINKSERTNYLDGAESSAQMEKLVNYSNGTSLSLVDENGKLISSTDKNKEIDPIYSFSETQGPSKYITLNDNLFLLIEMKDFYDEETNQLRIKENIYYYINMPDHIIPSEQIVIKDTNENTEIKLFNSGQAEAFGGIYENVNGGYIFKIRFENLENVNKLSATFQFSLKLSNTIYNQTTDLKTLTLDDFNPLQLWIKNQQDPVVPPETNPYDLTQSISNINNSDNYYLTVNLKDKRDANSQKTKGSFYVDLGVLTGVTFSLGMPFENIDVYVNGSIMLKENMGYFTNKFYNDDIVVNFSIKSVDTDLYYYYQNNTEYCDIENNVQTAYTCLGNVFEFTVSSADGSEATGISELKIVIKEKKVTTRASYFENKTTYTDYTGVTTQLEVQDERYSSGSLSNSKSYLDNYIYNGDSKTPTKFTHNITVESSSNYIEIEVDNKIPTNAGYRFDYYTDVKCLVMHCDMNDSIRLYINKSQISFYQGGMSPGSPVIGQVIPPDPQIQKQMKEVMGEDWDKYTSNNGYSFGIQKSSSLNENGEYYYLVFGYDMREHANNNYQKYGRGDYSNYTNIQPGYSRQDGAPKIKLWVFNVAGKEVSLQFDYYLSNSTRGISTTSGGLIAELETTIKNNTSEIIKTSTFDSGYNRQMNVKGSFIGDDYIQWEVVINNDELKYKKDRWTQTYFAVNLHQNHEFVDDYSKVYFDLNKNRVTNSSNNTIFFENKHIHYCQYSNTLKGCNPSLGITTLSTLNENYNDYDKFRRFDGQDYNVYYGGQGNLDQYIYNDKLTLTFITKITNKSPGTEYTLDFEFMTFGGSPITNYGERSLMVDYSSTGTIYNYNGTKKSKKGESVREDKTITAWRVEEIISSMGSTTYNPNITLPYGASNTSEIYPNGSYQFFDKIDDPVGKNIHLSNLTAHISTDGSILPYTIDIQFDKNDLQNLDSEKCSNGVCVIVRYPTDDCLGGAHTDPSCLTYFYGNDYMDTVNSLYNGFSVEITGVQRATYYIIDYETEINNNELLSYVLGDEIALLTDVNYNFNNSIYVNDWHDATAYPTQPRYTTSAASLNDQIKVLADISVDKKIEEETDAEYLTRDTTKNTTTVKIGYTGSEYVKLDDIIKGIASGKQNVDTVELVDIKELKKYLELKNLKINYYPTTETTSPTIIFEAGQFIDEWSESSFTTNPNDDKLYSLYLKNKNTIIPAESKFEIVYDLVFDVDNKRGIKDDNGQVLGSYRPNDNYKGDRLYVISNIEGIRPYTSETNSTGTSTHEPFNNYIDYDNKELHVFNSNDIRSGYLIGPTANKVGTQKSDKEYKYEIEADLNSAGKSTTASFEAVDTISLELEIPEDKRTDELETKKNNLDYLLKDYIKIKDILITASNKHDNSSTKTLINTEGYLTPGIKTYTNDGINFSYELEDGLEKNNLKLTASGFPYDTTIKIDYNVEIDYESFFKKAIENNLLTEELLITGSDIKYEPNLVNQLKSNEGTVIFAQYSSGRIRLHEVVPTVNKTVEYPNEDDALWTISANTGFTAEEIMIKDTYTIEGSNDQIKDAIDVKDIIIKIDDEVIYENGSLDDNWKNNITINGLEFHFKNTEDNKFINENKNITITYKTHFDIAKYNELGGSEKGSYSIKNKVNLEKGTIRDNSVVYTKNIEFNYNPEYTKEYLGNPNGELEKTKWKIEFSSKDINIKNVIIKDRAIPSSNFGSYLSLNDIVIKTIKNDEETVLYDHKNGINNIETSTKLTTIDSKELVFNKNGYYDFMLNIPLIKSNTKVVIEYEYIIDKEKYAYDKQPTDIELLIQNEAIINYSDSDDIELNANGASVVPSLMAKRHTTLSQSKDNLQIKWDIDINLDVEYKDALKEDDEVIITDKLFEGLEYEEDSLQVYNRELNDINYVSTTELTKDVDYEFTYEDNTIKVKLLKPNINNNVRISFNTNSKLLSDSLKNFLTLSVNNKPYYVSSEEVSGVFLSYMGGTVTSQGVTYYSIFANKYLDDKLSKQPFNFELIEVNYEGETIKNGIKIRAINNKEGKITFGPLLLDSEGIHYFKVKEISGKESINYDQKEYTLKMEVINFENVYTVSEIEIINSNDEEMNFYNTTKKEGQDDQETSSNLTENPNTKPFSKITIIIIVWIVVSALLIVLLLPRNRFKLD